MTEPADVIIVGSGIAGAAVYGSLQGSGCDVVVVEAGPGLSPNGRHLRNLGPDDVGAWRALVSAFLRPPVRAGDHRLEGVPPAGAESAVRSDQLAEESLPGYGLCRSVGGNGLLWSGIVMPPSSPQENLVGSDELEDARVRLGAQPVADSPRQSWLQETHGLVPVPLAWSPESGWHGPQELAGPGFHPIWGQSVVRVRHRAGRATGVELSTAAGRAAFLAARQVVLAAGVVGNARLLWSSGLTEELPGIGRGVVHHPMAAAQVSLSRDDWSCLAELPGLDRPALLRDADCPPGLHTVIVAEPAYMMEGTVDARAILSVYAYAQLDRRRENRVCFAPERAGPDGLALPRFQAPLSDEEAAVSSRALGEARRWAERLGRTLPSGRPRLLPRGSDQHLVGGTSIGPPGDELAVADPDGRVLGFDNLWVAGAGAVRCAVSTHPVQTIVALAFRTGRRIREALRGSI